MHSDSSVSQRRKKSQTRPTPRPLKGAARYHHHQRCRHLQKRTGCLHDMVWKYHIFTIDRLVLCLVLRYYESKEAQVCNLLVTFLLLKNPSFRERVQTFVQEPMDAFVHDDGGSCSS
ncbi:mediator of RNA polymerase II transcription subunit 23-like [Xenia sp. Carnegie-2017]|uniref:mediator of RNA polymerase II transcription subunit 23-like n=1 Tax=Xenia sp. Carnegie-2017 TaxID=2897299 RepID=UPI001F03B1E8|nr:mediator of RNA polymerase II transcription subunit 23-like [Xenia sp. Carnegie-2017]